MQKRIYGLLGFPLTHSFSKTWFEEKFKKENISDCIYENFELPKIEDVKELLKHEDIAGFNVTIPYKKLIIPYLNEIDRLANEVGAVNCVKRIGNSWKGFNTDVVGFENALKPLLSAAHTSAIVLGTGGASHAVWYVLEKLGIHVIKVSSHEQENALSYYDLNDDILKENKLIINTTPLGTFPNEEECPQLIYEDITPAHLCFDLIYNPEESLFLKKSKAMGAAIKNGYEMLELQAAESWRIWNSSEN